MLSADILSNGDEIDGVFVRIFHLAPNSDEKLFDYESLHYIPADGSDMVSIPFWPDTPGEHRFVIVAARPGAVEGVERTTLFATDSDDTGTFYFPIVTTE